MSRAVALEGAASRAQPASALVRYADALLCATALLIGEAVAVAIEARRELAGSHEVFQVLITLLPIAVAAAAPLCAGGALLSASLPRAAESRGAALLLPA